VPARLATALLCERGPALTAALLRARLRSALAGHPHLVSPPHAVARDRLSGRRAPGAAIACLVALAALVARSGPAGADTGTSSCASPEPDDADAADHADDADDADMCVASPGLTAPGPSVDGPAGAILSEAAADESADPGEDDGDGAPAIAPRARAAAIGVARAARHRAEIAIAWRRQELWRAGERERRDALWLEGTWTW
jgi:hypothetical protein